MNISIIRELPILDYCATFTTMQEDPDNLIAKNLKRIRLQKGLSQADVGRLVGGLDKDKVSGYETGNIPMGKGMLMRFCRALDVDLWEFYVTEESPIVRDEQEQQKLYLYREERRLGVAEEIEVYEKFRIETAYRKTDKDDTGPSSYPVPIDFGPEARKMLLRLVQFYEEANRMGKASLIDAYVKKMVAKIKKEKKKIAGQYPQQKKRGSQEVHGNATT